MSVCLLGIAAAQIGCGGDDSSFTDDVDYGVNNGGYDELGATPGGAQDIAYARALIEAGSIPPSDAITVEGLLSEHDLPIMGEPCEDLLCLRPVVGVAPDLSTGRSETWIHIGMTSGFHADFVRPPIDVVVVVDKSSTMDVDIAETTDAVIDIIDQMRDDDRIAIVTFDDSARTLLAATRGADLDRAAVDSQVRNIHAAGGANLMAGLVSGYDIARGMDSGPTRMSRVIVMSCGYPDASTGDGSFADVVESGADDGIGLTFLGVLLSFDYQLAQSLGTMRGGNYYFLEDLQRVEQLFEDDFEFMVTPLAYDLQVKLGVDPTQWRIDHVYGLPGEPGAAEAGFDVTTAFLSKGGGGIVVGLSPVVDQPSDAVAQVRLSYDPETALGWTESIDEDVVAMSNAGLSDAGVRKSVALVNMAEQMRRAIDESDVNVLLELRTYLRGEAEALGDPELAGDVELVEKLIALM